MLSAPLEIMPLLSQFLSQKLIKGLMLFPWKTPPPLALSSPLLKIPMSGVNNQITICLALCLFVHGNQLSKSMAKMDLDQWLSFNAPL